jgi:hypothetical protein
MKFNFKKISAVLVSGFMAVSGIGFAAAANYPQPFVVGGSANAAVVYGTGAGAMDQAPANSIGNYLATKVTTTGAPIGESFLLARPTDRLNIGDDWDIFAGTIDDDELPMLLAEGTYVAGDNDNFEFRQKIELGNPVLSHFRDNDYEDLIGLPDKTPTVGFKINSGEHILNYTLEFIDDAESDVVGGDLEDIEGSDLTLFGKTYYVSDFVNSSSNTEYFGKLTLLDTATVHTVYEGETVEVTAGGKTYEVSIDWVDETTATFIVDGERAPGTGHLREGESYRLKDGSYIGVRDVSKLVLTGSVGQATFSIGSGKLEIVSGSDVELNDDEVDEVKGYVYRGSTVGGTEKVEKIVLEWVADDERFLTPDTELVMPGFGGLKFTMNDLIRLEEEKIILEHDGDKAIELTLPIEDTQVSIGLVYANGSGSIIGIGTDTTERLATASGDVLEFIETMDSSDYHEYFVASYATTKDSESYLLKVDIDKDSEGNKTTVRKKVDDGWKITDCEDVRDGETCDIGDVRLTVGTIRRNATFEAVNFTAGSSVNFNTIYSKSGLKVYLPYEVANSTADTTNGAINFTSPEVSPGHDENTFYLFMDGEDKDENLAGGTEFNFTIDEDEDGELQVEHVNNEDSAGPTGFEVGSASSMFETYIVDDVAPRVLHYTKDNDYAEIYYPSGGESETYAEVYITELEAVTAAAGNMVFKDTERTSWQNKNVIIVGGSCINSAAAEVLGGDYCESVFTSMTDVGVGQYLIQSFGDAFTSGKIALLIAGYNAEDTVAAAGRLTEPGAVIDTTAGTKYIGTVGVEGSSTMSKVE